MKTFPTTIIICGITGDLAQKKILPALFDLYHKGDLDDSVRIVGFSRREMSEKEVREMVQSNSNIGTGAVGGRPRKFISKISYISGQFDDPESYKKLSEHLADLDKERNGCSNKLFYFSVPPSLYEMLSTQISQSGLSIPCGGDLGFARILIEKPFGNDLKTAEHLDALLGQLFHEEQIFRIDHYLAKESLFKIIDIHRQKNGIVEKWNKDYIKEVHINLFEKSIVGSRGPSYDGVGAFRDVGQNHILQMLALVAMEIPKKQPLKATVGHTTIARFQRLSRMTETAKNIQSARTDVLKNLIIPKKSEIEKMSRGQYVGYLKEPGVAEHSLTETFFKMTVFVNTENFSLVPFVLTSGKAMDRNLTEIVVIFKDGLRIVFDVPVEDSMPAYQKILLDCILGDQTVFTSTEEVLAEWRFVTPIVEMWREIRPFLYNVGVRLPEAHGPEVASA